MAKIINKKSWILFASILFMVVLVFSINWFLKDQMKVILNKTDIFLKSNRYEEAWNNLDGKHFIFKNNKKFLLLECLVLIQKKVVDTVNFSDADLNLIKNNLNIIERKKLSYLEQWDLGYIYENLDDYNKALEYYLLASKYNKLDKSDRAELLSDIGHIYDYLKENQKAKDYYERSVKEDPSNVLAKWRYIGRVLDINNIKERKIIKEKALEILNVNKPASIDILVDTNLMLGKICLLENNTNNNCLDYFLKALNLDKNNYYIYDDLALVYLSNSMDNSLYFVNYPKKVSFDELSIAKKYINKSLSFNNQRAFPYLLLSVADESFENGNAQNDLKKALILTNADNTLWGKTKDDFRALIYFKLALFENQDKFIKMNLDLAIKNNNEIREEILELVQKNQNNAKIQKIGQLLDK